MAWHGGASPCKRVDPYGSPVHHPELGNYTSGVAMEPLWQRPAHDWPVAVHTNPSQWDLMEWPEQTQARPRAPLVRLERERLDVTTGPRQAVLHVD